MLLTLSSTEAENDNWLKLPFHNHLKFRKTSNSSTNKTMPHMIKVFYDSKKNKRDNQTVLFPLKND